MKLQPEARQACGAGGSVESCLVLRRWCGVGAYSGRGCLSDGACGARACNF